MKKKRNGKSSGRYVNIEETPMMANKASYLSILLKALNRSKDISPSHKIPALKTNLKNIYTEAPTIVWFGHSSYLIHYKGKNILVDPVFSNRVSPIPGMLKAFPGSNIYKVEDMPAIDFVIITHNHYDHLDKKVIKKIDHKVKSYYTPKDVAYDLIDAGVSSSKIDEMNWGNSIKIMKKTMLRSVTARHFSGRGLRRNTSLWSAYVLELYDWKIFIGGDSGYGQHFKDIGKQHGPFDIALLECGQYDKAWPYIHMQPEETLQAAEDLNAEILLPVHWGKFALANHPWNEPVNKLLAAAKNNTIRIATPKIGEPVTIGESLPTEKWWDL